LHNVGYSLDIPEYLAMAVMTRRLSSAVYNYELNPIDFLIPSSVEDVVLKSLSGEAITSSETELQTSTSRVVRRLNMSAETIRTLMNNPSFRRLMQITRETESSNNYNAIQSRIIQKTGSREEAFRIAKRDFRSGMGEGKIFYKVQSGKKQETSEVFRKIENATRFTDLPTHPFAFSKLEEISTRENGLYTSAAGAYQFTRTTWSWIEREYKDLLLELAKPAQAEVSQSGNEVVVTAPEPMEIYVYDQIVGGRLIKDYGVFVPFSERNQDYMAAIYLTHILALELSEEEWDRFLSGAGFGREETVGQALASHFEGLKNVSLNTSLLRASVDSDYSTLVIYKKGATRDKLRVGEVTLDVTRVNDREVVYIPRVKEIYYKVRLFMGSVTSEEKRARGAQYLTNVRMTLTVPGNAMWRIFDTFLLDGVPEVYYRNGYFIVTKLSHRVSGGSWLTEVEAKFFYTGET